MSTLNRFFNRVFNANRGTQARSRPIRTEYASIEGGFKLVQDELDALNGRYLPKVETELIDYTFPALTTRTRVHFTANEAVTARLVTGRFLSGDTFIVIQEGTGNVSITAEEGVTLRTVDGSVQTGKQWAIVEVICLGLEVFQLRPIRDSARLTGGNSFTGAQTVAFVALTDAETIATNASLSNHFSVTLEGNRTLANPTNMRDGGIYNWRIKQDGTGSRTLAYGSKFKWPGGIEPLLSTAAGSVDRIVGQYQAADDVIECVITKAFS
jgi:hypothetical protein